MPHRAALARRRARPGQRGGRLPPPFDTWRWSGSTIRGPDSRPYCRRDGDRRARVLVHAPEGALPSRRARSISRSAATPTAVTSRCPAGADPRCRRPGVRRYAYGRHDLVTIAVADRESGYRRHRGSAPHVRGSRHSRGRARALRSRERGTDRWPPPRRRSMRFAPIAPVAALIVRRGRWVLLARWDLKSATVEPGTWFRGKIYQRRCDVSPDGSLFYYFALKGGRPFHAVSRLPWLTALALWKDNTTYGSGAHLNSCKRESKPLGTTFRSARSGHPGPADDATPAAPDPQQRPAVRRRAPSRLGRASETSPIARDHFNERRHQWLICDQPTGSARLELRDAGYQGGRFEGRAPAYALDGQSLDDVVWPIGICEGRCSWPHATAVSKFATPGIRSARRLPGR